MTVDPEELPTGSKLIMGLNPPLGVKAALANKFIDKALKLKPKLLILIVPKETERLDEKPAAYDLIWEDEQKLSGRSFYLPGSVDIDDKQMEQWNLKPPLLYLWSHPEWTPNHKAIAAKHGHISSVHEKPNWGVGKKSVGPVHLPEYHGYHSIQSEVPDHMAGVTDCSEGYLETIAPFGASCPDEVNYVQQGPSVYTGPPPPGDRSSSWSRPHSGSQNPFPGDGASCGWFDL